LITVPSCDAHNAKKSKDDEFFRATLLLVTAQHSKASKHQFFQKLLVASRRMPRAHTAFIADAGSVAGGAARALHIDRARFDACVDHLARAIFFDVNQGKWLSPLRVVSPNFFSAVAAGLPVAHNPSLQAVELIRSYIVCEPILGENTDVFKYRLKVDAEAEIFAFAGQFFGLFEVFVYSSKTIAVVV
jgi:hypothetical protein